MSSGAYVAVVSLLITLTTHGAAPVVATTFYASSTTIALATLRSLDIFSSSAYVLESLSAVNIRLAVGSSRAQGKAWSEYWLGPLS